MKHCLTALVLIATIALPGASAAQGRSCGERERIVERLQSKYGEARAGSGLSSNNGVLEIFASEETGTWTILLTMPNGQSCLVAAGESWEGGPSELTKSGLPV